MAGGAPHTACQSFKRLTHMMEAAMPTTADVARAYNALLRSGQFAAAREQFWAADIKSVEPAEMTGGHGARSKSTRWFEAQQVDDLTIDGPFVTGNQFALFIDMMITDRANGDSQPFAEIAIFTVCDAKITEERYFYD
jgi:SnoaL-like domain